MIPHSYADLPPQYFSGAVPTAAILTIKDYLIEAAQQHVDAVELFGLPVENGGEVLKSTLAPISAATKDIFVRKYTSRGHARGFQK